MIFLTIQIGGMEEGKKGEGEEGRKEGKGKVKLHNLVSKIMFSKRLINTTKSKTTNTEICYFGVF